LLTDVQAGELDLNTAGNNSFAGDLQVSGGTAKLLRADQIPDGKTVTINSGTLALQGFSDTVAGVAGSAPTKMAHSPGGHIVGAPPRWRDPIWATRRQY